MPQRAGSPDGAPLRGAWMMRTLSPSVDEYIGKLILKGPFGDGA